MKAIVVKRENKTPLLSWEEISDVQCGPDEVLVDVKATAVNRADLLQAQGLYPPPPGESEILGLEMAGVVAAVGNAVQDRQIGDRVLALLPGGGYAQQAAVHHQMLIDLPGSWSFAEGAAIAEVWLTAFVNLFVEGALQPGEAVMIHAGGSGVGTAGIQLAREAGAVVYVTAGSQSKLDKCCELGAELAVNYKEQNFFEAVMAATGGSGVDLILDPVGGARYGVLKHCFDVGGLMIPSVSVLGKLPGGYTHPTYRVPVVFELQQCVGKGTRLSRTIEGRTGSR